MSDIKKYLESLANDPYIEHEDYNKCGLCLKEKIRSTVAKEFLDAGKLNAENLKEMFAEVERRWKETELFKRVIDILSQGKTIEQIDEELKKEGIDI